MKFVKALCALALLSATTGLMALKVIAPEVQCEQQGLQRGTAAFNQCVQQKDERIRQMQRDLGYTSLYQGTAAPQSQPQSQYGPQTGFVPPYMRAQ